MIKKTTLNENWLFVGVLVISVLLIIAVFSRLMPADLEIFFNSDTLYLPSLYKDLFIDGNGLKDWNLSPSPGFFPDMLLYFILMFLFDDFIIASFVFPIIQYLAILILFSIILKLVLPEHSKVYATISGLLMLMFFYVTLYSDDFYFTFFLLSNAFHAGAMVMTLLCVALTFNYLKTGKRNKLSLIVVFSVLAILSDRLFIIMYLAPFILISIFYIFNGQRKKFYPLLIANIIGLIAGLVFFKVIIQSAYIYLAKPHKLLDPFNSIDSFVMLMNQMGAYIFQFNFKTAIILFSLISFICICIIFFKDFTRNEAGRNDITTVYSLYSILFSLFVFGAPILSGSYTGWDTIRYNIGFFYLSVLNLSFVLYMYLKKYENRLATNMWLKKITIGLAAIALLTGLLGFSQEGIKKYFAYYPETVKEIDEISEKYNLKMGVGNYWIAKHTTMFSKTGVAIHPVFDHIEPAYHTTNENWFYSDSAIYDYIVLNRFTDTDAYKGIFGEGKLLTTTEYSKIVRVKPFKFDRETHRPYFVNLQD